LVGVESGGLTRVDAVTLKTDNGQEIRFVVSAAADRTSHAPSPGHLRQHMTYGDRVVIHYRDDPAGPLALVIDDGG
jgi:hypothetical protein